VLIEITSHTNKTPKEIASTIFKHLSSVPGLIRGQTDLDISNDDEDLFIIIAKQEKERQIKALVQQLETELNFSTKWINR